jgi:hypothetical protein
VDDFVVQVKQIAQYGQATPGPADAILFQQGGIGGNYVWTNPAGIVAPAIAQAVTTAAINLSDASWIKWGATALLQANAASGLSFTVGSVVPFSVGPTGIGALAGDLTVGGKITVGQGPVNPNDVATAQYVADNTVWTFNGRKGNVILSSFDIRGAGGAPINSPAFSGIPTAPSISDPGQYDFQIANTAFVQDAVNCRIMQLLHAHPFVWTFNGRIGDITLTAADITGAGGAPINSPAFTGMPTAPNPPLGDASTRIATTLFVDGSVEDLRSWVEHQNFAFRQDLTLYAPLASPQFSGLPTAPTAAPGDHTAQLATTAFVMNAVSASTTGVVSFNTRTGVVTLTAADITNATGALLASPVFTGTPQAPTATLGTDTAQLATCAFVIAELGGASIGVMTFNGRGGAVVLTGADITSAGGALLAGPAFSGVPTAPTAATGVATQQLATTAFVSAAISALSIGVSSFNSRTGAVTLTANDVSAAGGAILASPAFSGTPTAPTAAPGVSTTQLATCAFVAASIAAATGVSSFNGRAGAVTLTGADVSGVGAAMLTGGTYARFTGDVTIAETSPYLILSKSAAGANAIMGRNGTSSRWEIVLGNSAAETGGNAGSDFNLLRFNDAGAQIDSPLSFVRSNGSAVFSSSVSAGSITSAVTATTGSYFFGNTGGKYITYDGTNFQVAGGIFMVNGNMYVGSAASTASIYFGNVGNGSVGISTTSFNCFSNAGGSEGMYIALNTSAWSAVSDARLPYKRTARKLTVLDKIEAIQLYENEVEDRLELFGKAQEISKSFPHVVKRGDDDETYVPTGMSDERAWGLSYERLSIVALQGVKELLVRITALEAALENIGR